MPTTAAIPKQVKDKTGVMMRLVYYLREKEIEFYTKGKLHAVRKTIYALQAQVDKKIAEYFREFPDEKPHSRKQSSGNRTAIFIRQLQELRGREDKYWKFGEPHTVMFPLRFYIDNHMDAYFWQYPDEAPDKIKQYRQQQ